MRIVRKGDVIQYYDAQGILRIEESYGYKKWYDDGEVLRRHDTDTGTIIYDGQGTKVAEFSMNRCGVYTDATNFLEFIATGLSLKKDGEFKFSFGTTGGCEGSNGTYTYTFDPADLNANARFKSTEACKDGAAATIRVMRTDPPA